MTNSTQAETISIDRLIAEGWFSTPEWRALADFTIDGRRLGAEPYQRISRSFHETRLERKQGEAFLLSCVLAHLGHRDVALRARESPDFTATFGSAISIGIEVAEVVEPKSARWRNAIENVRIGVRDAVDANPNLQIALANRYVSLDLWRCPERTAEFRLIREIPQLLLSDLLSGGSLGSRITDKRFPTLVEHWAHLYVNAFDGGYIDVTAAANSFDPRGLAEVALKVLKRKQKKAHAYDTTFPLWLILCVTDQRGVFSESLDLLERFEVDITPYERVIIFDNGRAVIWEPRALRPTG
jgi:hypothetical protein